MSSHFEFGLVDTKVRGINVMLNMTVEDYWKLAQHILEKNPFQRRKQRPGDRIYQYLRNDLLEGCVILPIVLATTDRYANTILKEIEYILTKGTIEKNDLPLVERLVSRAIQETELMILDGLQRTYTLEEIMNKGDSKSTRFLGRRYLRIELYLGLKKAGLLYRMLTLNTGQLPMSFRHQLEIVYSDYVDYNALPEGITLVREVDRTPARTFGTYRLSDIIDLYHSFLAGDSSPTDKKTILETITSTEFLDSYDSRSDDDLLQLLLIFHHFISSIHESAGNWVFEESESLTRPWGKNVYAIFSRTQVMTGFGSACKMFLENTNLAGLAEIDRIVLKPLPNKDTIRKGLNELLLVMNEITESGYKTKIGNLQREYFRFYFRNYLELQQKGTLDLVQCARNSLKEFSKIY